MNFKEALQEAYNKGYLDNIDNPFSDNNLVCFGSIRRYETILNCDKCPLNRFCEEENDRHEQR